MQVQKRPRSPPSRRTVYAIDQSLNRKKVRMKSILLGWLRPAIRMARPSHQRLNECLLVVHEANILERSETAARSLERQTDAHANNVRPKHSSSGVRVAFSAQELRPCVQRDQLTDTWAKAKCFVAQEALRSMHVFSSQ